MNQSQQYQAQSVRELAAAVERVAPHDPALWESRARVPGAGGVLVQVSKERARQLWMVVAMFDRAVGHEGMPPWVGRSAKNLFHFWPLGVFWQLATAGELRRWEKDVGKPLPAETQRIVRSCIRVLGGLVVRDWVVRLPAADVPESRPTVDPGQLTAVYRELVSLAGGGPLERDGLGIKAQERARLLAMVSVVLDTGARVGELEAMNVDDLADDLGTVGVLRRPQHGGYGYEEVAYRLQIAPSTVRKVMSGHGGASEQLKQEILREVEDVAAQGPVVERYPLREGTGVALKRWLTVRDELVAPLEGGKSGLWVTVFPSKAGPPGVRIRAQGLGQSYARGVTALNFVMAGQPGWEPLPVRMEQLRRAVWAEPLPDEDGQCGPS